MALFRLPMISNALPSPMSTTPSPSSPTLRLKKLSPHAALPAYQSDQAAGMDLAACLDGGDTHPGITLTPAHKGGLPILIPCGFAMALPPGWEGQVRPRSGLSTRFGVTMPNAPGTVDSDYRGPMMVPLINLGPEPYIVKHGARIAQLIIAPVARAAIVEVLDLDATERGSGGFGSTGS